MAKILHGGGNGPVMINIRLRRLAKEKPTPRECIAALTELRQTGFLPFGWQFMWVDWKNPELYGTDWHNMRRGNADDLARFNRVLEMDIRNMKVHFVRRVTG